MKYSCYERAFALTKDPMQNADELRKELKSLGFDLGTAKDMTDAQLIAMRHHEYSRWLISHGLDITRSDLPQQALINDNAKAVKAYIAACRAKKRDNKKIGQLQKRLEDAGITILSDRRLERCLQITADKTKAYARIKAKQRHASKRLRQENKYTPHGDTLRDIFEYERNRMIDSLVLNGASPNEVERELRRGYESLAKGDYDLDALDEAYGDYLNAVIELTIAATS